MVGCSGSPGQQDSTANSEPASPSAKQRFAALKRRPATLPATDVAADEDSGPADRRRRCRRSHLVRQSTAQLQEDLIRSVIDNFNRLDEFDPSQILPQLNDRLNQWMWQSRHRSNWQRDPLLDTLDASLIASPATAYSLQNLDLGLFTLNDMIGLQEVDLAARHRQKRPRRSARRPLDRRVTCSIGPCGTSNWSKTLPPARPPVSTRLPKSCCWAAARPASGHGFFCCCCVNKGSTASCWRSPAKAANARAARLVDGAWSPTRICFCSMRGWECRCLARQGIAWPRWPTWPPTTNSCASSTSVRPAPIR